ncbi:MAG TPA: hypothetical protein IGS37_18030 [Synechococcales cyanobacterium M55_K2018_004]|nr:hypothetical protein [Synechococcales cyanobacterium M55_K2018_004]
MVKTVTDDMLDPNTPEDVIIRPEPRTPTTDPTLGIPVQLSPQGTPKHRLVTLGDSLTHGFQSGAIFKTRLAYPVVVAQALGWNQFRFPTYDSPGDGLPLNFESLVQRLQGEYGDRLDWWELIPTFGTVRYFLDEVEDYWEGPGGTNPPRPAAINHNLAVYGWDLRNTFARTAEICRQTIAATPDRDNFLRQVVTNANDRAALRVLDSARAEGDRALTPVQAAAALGAEGTVETGAGDGIETLIVFIGANNALGAILTFRVNWTGPGYDDMAVNDQYTVWRPIHFKAELDLLVSEVKKVRARHVIWCTIPHVTIAPFAKGVGSEKVRPGSRYFPYYTYPWIRSQDFKPRRHAQITGAQTRTIDSAIDQYNDMIAEAVRAARQQGLDWYLCEVVALLDRLAYRRYIEDPTARPDWWTPYPLPPELQALQPPPDSRFFVSDRTGRKQGGLFSLDGIHPTTIGYGLLAQEIINVMQLAGVSFDRSPQLDFNRLIKLDSLISQPPPLIANILNLFAQLDSNFNLIGTLLGSNL